MKLVLVPFGRAANGWPQRGSYFSETGGFLKRGIGDLNFAVLGRPVIIDPN